MSLTEKYELGTPVSDTAVAFDKSIEGRQISTGRPIAVHLLAGGYNPENQTLLREIAALPPEYKACFLESGDHHGTPYVVTDSLAGAPPFRRWFSALQSRRSGSSGGPPDLGQKRAWQIPVRVSSQAPAEPVKKTVAAPPVKAPAPYDPGEATQLIEIPMLASEPPVKAAEPPPPPPPVAKQEPGEFTRMFQVPASATQAPPEVEGPRGNACVAGEFTQMFRSPEEPVAAPVAQAAPPVPAPSPAPSPKVEEHQASEFTQFFKTFSPEAAPASTPQAQVAPAPPPVSPTVSRPPVATPVNSEATILFQVPPPPPAAPKQSATSTAPGEFTQMFASPAPARQTPAQPGKGFEALFSDTPIPDNFPRAAESPANAAQPGEFTRMMESPLSRAGLKPQQFTPAQPANQPTARSAESHEFTRMLESPVSPQSEVPSAPAAARQGKPSGEATRAFRFPEPAAAAPATPPAGPSEFTQMFKAPPKEVEPAPVKAPVKLARVKPRKKPNNAYLIWILAGSGILLIVVVIVYFAVRD